MCIPDNALLVTADVVGLYPSIPHQAGLSTLKEALDKRLLKKIPTDDLIKMAELVLSNNFFEFNSDTFQQISGTAIGTKCAPPHACIYMDQAEQKFLATQIDQPLIWLRYIDDIFFIWTHGEKELEKFMSSFNSFFPNLKFTYESSKKDISFLDLQFSLSKNKLSTDFNIKLTDCHQYLHYSSGHPERRKRSTVHSQLLRVSWVCSCEKDFNQHKSNMKIWFQKQEYPEKIIENEIKKANFPSCNKIQRKKSKGIPFLVTYHPLLKQLEGILCRNKYLLNVNSEVKQTFTPVPMVSYRSARKLSSYLVRAKFYAIDRIVGSKGCGKKRCEVCVNVFGTDTFSSTVTGETFKINHKLNFDDKCLTHLFTCKCCGKQYVGETTGEQVKVEQQ